MTQSSNTKRLRISGRSILSFVLVPEAPIGQWVITLDDEMQRSKGFFAGQNFILDLRLLEGNVKDISELFDALTKRNIRVIGVEGGEQVPQLLKKWGIANGLLSQQNALPRPPESATQSLEEEIKPRPYVFDSSVRSGQHIVWPDGDLIILGNVASGAEVTAGGSIHIYGTLNGRAIAGIGNHASARIFTKKLSAELVAIDGFYATAEEMDDECFNKPCCIYLVKEKLHFKKFL